MGKNRRLKQVRRNKRKAQDNNKSRHKPNKQDPTIGDLLGNPTEKEMDSILREALSAAGVDLSRFGDTPIENILRQSAPVNTEAWEWFLEDIMGWELDNCVHNESFHLPFAISRYEGRDVMIYALPFGHPSDLDDPMLQETFAKIEKTTADFAGHKNIPNPASICLFKIPNVKKVDGRWYSHFGMVLTNGRREHMLLAQGRHGIEIAIDDALSGIDLSNPGGKYEDIDAVLAMSCAAALAGHHEDNQPGKFRLFGKEGDWQSIMVGEEADMLHELTEKMYHQANNL